MKDKQFLRSLLEYNQWANETTYRKVAELPPEEVRKKRKTLLESIHVSLNHLLNVDEMWLAHMQGRMHGIEGLRVARYDDFDELWARRREMDQTLFDYFDSLSDDEIEEVVEYELLGGNTGALSRAMCFMHLVNHGTYHRGWIADMFGQADAIQPTTDIPVYERALREAGRPALP